MHLLLTRSSAGHRHLKGVFVIEYTNKSVVCVNVHALQIVINVLIIAVLDLCMGMMLVW